MDITRKPPARFSTIAPWLLMLIAVLATVLVYYPGLSGPFLMDDGHEVQQNPYLNITDLDGKTLRMALGSPEPAADVAGPLARISLALNHYLWGDGGFSFKAVNLAFHVGSGFLLFVLAGLLLRQSQEEFQYAGLHTALAAFAWMLHPLNLTLVLHVSERATVLAVFFGLLALVFYVQGRMAGISSRRFLSRGHYVLALVCFFAALASREEAMLLPVVVLAIEWLFFSADDGSRASRMRSFWIWGLMVLISAAFLYWHNSQQAADLVAVHVLTERLLTSARALLYYLVLTIVPWPGEFSLFHDDFVVSSGVFSPPATLLALLAIPVLIYGVLRYRRKQPVVALAILLFMAAHLYQGLACCGSLAGEQISYPFSFGVLLVAVIGIMSIRLPVLTRDGKLLIILACSIFFAGVTHGRVKSWQDMNRWTFTTLKNHPDSPTANYQAAVMHVELSREPLSGTAQKDDHLHQAVDYFEKAASLNPGDAAPLLAAMLLDAMDRESAKKNMLDALLSGSTSTRVPLVLDRDGLRKKTKLALQSGVPSKWVVDNLLRLSRCERSGKCQISAGAVESLLEAFLGNDRLPHASRHRAKLLDEMAQRAFGADDVAGAERLARLVMDIAPEDAKFSLNAAVIMAKAGDIDLARRYVKGILSGSHPQGVESRAKVLWDLLGEKEKGHE